MYDYNTSREHILLKEYGRNIQNLTAYLRTIEDKEKRNQAAATLVELMKMITPAHKDNPDTDQKFWDDLYIMSGFNLEIEGPFPMPEPEILNKKPQKVGYADNDIRYKHYGKNIELMIKKATELETAEERESAVIYIGKLMKSFFNSWNQDNIDDKVILKHIEELSKGQLTIDLEKVTDENLFESLYKNKPRHNKRRPQKGGSSSHHRRTGGSNRGRRRS